MLISRFSDYRTIGNDGIISNKPACIILLGIILIILSAHHLNLLLRTDG
jgi:hypothetical protein